MLFKRLASRTRDSLPLCTACSVLGCWIKRCLNSSTFIVTILFLSMAINCAYKAMQSQLYWLSFSFSIRLEFLYPDLSFYTAWCKNCWSLWLWVRLTDISYDTWAHLVATFKFLQYFLRHENHLKKIQFLMETWNPFGYSNCKEIKYFLNKQLLINYNSSRL